MNKQRELQDYKIWKGLSAQNNQILKIGECVHDSSLPIYKTTLDARFSFDEDKAKVTMDVFCKLCEETLFTR